MLQAYRPRSPVRAWRHTEATTGESLHVKIFARPFIKCNNNLPCREERGAVFAELTKAISFASSELRALVCMPQREHFSRLPGRPLCPKSLRDGPHRRHHKASALCAEWFRVRQKDVLPHPEEKQNGRQRGAREVRNGSQSFLPRSGSVGLSTAVRSHTRHIRGCSRGSRQPRGVHARRHGAPAQRGCAVHHRGSLLSQAS